MAVSFPLFPVAHFYLAWSVAQDIFTSFSSRKSAPCGHTVSSLSGVSDNVDPVLFLTAITLSPSALSENYWYRVSFVWQCWPVRKLSKPLQRSIGFCWCIVFKYLQIWNRIRMKCRITLGSRTTWINQRPKHPRLPIYGHYCTIPTQGTSMHHLQKW